MVEHSLLSLAHAQQSLHPGILKMAASVRDYLQPNSIRGAGIAPITAITVQRPGLTVTIPTLYSTLLHVGATECW